MDLIKDGMEEHVFVFPTIIKSMEHAKDVTQIQHIMDVNVFVILDSLNTEENVKNAMLLVENALAQNNINAKPAQM